METMMIDLHVHTIFSKEKCANLPVKETLKYYQRLGEYYGKRVIIRINDHNTIFGGVEAMEEYLKNREEYPNIFVIPGCEFNVDLSPVLKFDNENFVPSENGDNFEEKYTYVFKKAHIGASPCLKDLESYKKWKENKDLIVYSLLSKMHIDASDYTAKYFAQNQVVNTEKKDGKMLCNLGEQIIVSKNILRKKFGVIIPFSALENCTKDGLTKKEIIDNFFAVATRYFKQNYAPFADLTEEQIKNKLYNATLGYISVDRNRNLWKDYQTFVTKVSGKFGITLPDSIYYESVENSGTKSHNSIVKDIIDNTLSFCEHNAIVDDEDKNKIKQFALPLWRQVNGYIDLGNQRGICFDELASIIYDCGGYMDIEHPNSAFKLYENEYIPTELLKQLDLSLVKLSTKNPIENLIDSAEKVLIKDVFGDSTNNLDSTGLLKLQLLKKAIDKSNIKLTNNMLGAEIPKYYLYDVEKLDKALDIYADNNLLCSYGDDRHMNTVDKFVMLSKYEPKITAKNGKDYIIDKEFAQRVYDQTKDKLELKFDFEKYMIPTETKHFSYVKDYDQFGNVNSYEKTETYSNMVIQSSYCDAILGRITDTQNKSMITIRGGRVIENSDTENEEENKIELAK